MLKEVSTATAEKPRTIRRILQFPVGLLAALLATGPWHRLECAEAPAVLQQADGSVEPPTLWSGVPGTLRERSRWANTPGNNPFASFAALTWIAAPAILGSATNVLAMSESDCMLRAREGIQAL